MPNNREISILFWLIVAIVYAFLHPKVRPSFLGVLKAFCAHKIIISVLVLLLYSLFLIFFYYLLRIWNWNHLTTTIFWFFTTAFSVFFNIKNIHSGSYLKDLVMDQLKISVVLEFFVNLYSFPIWIELVFVPLLFILAALLVYASYKSEYVDVKGFLENILFSVFFYLLYKAIRMVFFSSEISVMTILNDVFIVPILSMSLIPFAYLLGVFTAYEDFSIQILFGEFKHEVQRC